MNMPDRMLDHARRMIIAANKMRQHASRIQNCGAMLQKTVDKWEQRRYNTNTETNN